MAVGLSSVNIHSLGNYDVEIFKCVCELIYIANNQIIFLKIVASRHCGFAPVGNHCVIRNSKRGCPHITSLNPITCSNILCVRLAFVCIGYCTDNTCWSYSCDIVFIYPSVNQRDSPSFVPKCDFIFQIDNTCSIFTTDFAYRVISKPNCCNDSFFIQFFIIFWCANNNFHIVCSGIVKNSIAFWIRNFFFNSVVICKSIVCTGTVFIAGRIGSRVIVEVQRIVNQTVTGSFVEHKTEADRIVHVVSCQGTLWYWSTIGNNRVIYQFKREISRIKVTVLKNLAQQWGNSNIVDE